MTTARRLALLIVLGAVLVALAVIVLVRNQSLDDELLATAALVGGLAVIVVALPANGHRSE